MDSNAKLERFLDLATYLTETDQIQWKSSDIIPDGFVSTDDSSRKYRLILSEDSVAVYSQKTNKLLKTFNVADDSLYRTVRNKQKMSLPDDEFLAQLLDGLP